MRRLLSGLRSPLCLHGDLGGLILPLNDDSRLRGVKKLNADLGRSRVGDSSRSPLPRGTLLIDVRPGPATNLNANGSFDLLGSPVGDMPWSLLLESQDTALDAEFESQLRALDTELYELKLWILIVSSMLSRASFSTGFMSRSLRRIVDVGDDVREQGFELPSVDSVLLGQLSSVHCTWCRISLSHGSVSTGNLRYDVKRGSFFK